MDIFQALILSLIEGITEFLPVSSTGHLTLTAQILNISQTEYVKSFEIIIQLGAILAVVALYYKKLFNTKIWPQILTSFIPSAFVGFFLYKVIKSFLIGNNLITVSALFLGGIIFILIELLYRSENKKTEDIKNIKLKDAFIIGLFQSISIIPGVSRAGASILGGLLTGLNRKTAAEFSFILAVPTMIAATSLDVFETKLNFSTSELGVLALGFFGSFIFALLTVKLFIKYLANHNFIGFGIYRMFVAIIFYIVYLR